jgi:hypothetical protein
VIVGVNQLQNQTSRSKIKGCLELTVGIAPGATRCFSAMNVENEGSVYPKDI